MNFRPSNFTELQILIHEFTKGRYGSEDDVYWFCAYQDARIMMYGGGTKDLARTFLDGYIPMNTHERVNEFLETLVDDEFDDNTGWCSQPGDLQELFKDFYGEE